MEQKGILLTCDVCGKTHFLKYEDREDYDLKPEGWAIHDGKDFCPACNREYNLVMERLIFSRRGGNK